MDEFASSAKLISTTPHILPPRPHPNISTQILSGLVMGRAVDICNRKLILFYSALVWNFATVCTGLSNNFAQLLLSQILLGMAESSAVPASFSLIADYFPAESLAQVQEQKSLLERKPMRALQQEWHNPGRIFWLNRAPLLSNYEISSAEYRLQFRAVIP